MTIKSFTFNPIMENTYLLIDDSSRECLIIDAGCLYSSEKLTLSKYIEDNHLTLRRVLNTHLHLDHCFGNRYIAGTFGVLPEAGEKDEFLLSVMKQHGRMFGFDLKEDAQPLKGYLFEGDTVEVGSIKLKVFEIPGHSPGGLAFYSEADGALFSGDSLFQGSIGRTDLDGGNYSDLVENISTKLLTLPDATIVYPGHGCNTTIAYEKQYNPYF